MTVAPPSASLTERIDAVLTGFVDARVAAWPEPELSPMLDALRHFVLNGGKRLRPAFCYWAWRGVTDGADGDEHVVAAGAALELFHAFALIHDDIIDESTRRRGRPSLHEEFAGLHAGQRWVGDGRAFGRNGALLAGDLCALWSEQVLTECGAPPPRLGEAQRIFAMMRAEAVAGEYLDIVAQATGDFDEAAAIRVIQLKTARYSVVRPLQIGAALAGADRSQIQAYAAFGEPLGEAFQLRDDVLGVFGEPERTGKSVLDDLRQAKPTVLLALALARSTAADRAQLRSLIGRPDLDDAGAGRVRQLMVGSGALAATEERIHDGHRRALDALAAMDIRDEAREALGALADLAVARSG
ncbi:putative polyprenyl synthetase [Rhizocola hellebori]|uniref:Putative polyprenyl synthetase n=1 Tax=Rhizocola hellebori TaxID=1392758 RepID=A0A8J3QGK2_9ACTN|nr:polyprenyl synthetase family protein [Rhizocola hellebori]GIH09038.1 putative polyprenyl synthetase [Rhizocola hellebori]